MKLEQIAVSMWIWEVNTDYWFFFQREEERVEQVGGTWTLLYFIAWKYRENMVKS